MELLTDIDCSDENWQRIVEKHKRIESYEIAKRNKPVDPRYIPAWMDKMNGALNRSFYDARNEFLRFASDSRYELFKVSGVSFFCGHEERLYRLLCAQGLKREDYPTSDEARFIQMAQQIYRLAGGFAYYLGLTREEIKPHLIIRWRVPEWREAIILGGYHERPELEWLITVLDKYLKNPDDFDETQAQLADEIIAVLEEPDIPDVLKEKVRELRNV